MSTTHVHDDTEVLDPVCGMTIAPSDAAGHYDYKGQTYYFCAESCRERFRADPESFLNPPEEDAATAAARAAAGAADTREYTCPMDPEIRQIGPGACPKCGMALEPVEVSLDDDRNPELDDMERRFRVSLALTVPILAFMVSDVLPGQPL